MKKITRLTLIVNGVTLLLVADIVIVLATPVPREGWNVPDVSVNRSASDLTPDLVKSRPPFDVYAEVFNAKKNKFQSSMKENAGVDGERSLSEKSGDFLSSDYKVVGILIDQHPQVVFERNRDQETIFLSIGDEMQGAVVKEIFPGKVVIDDNGKNVELDLEQDEKRKFSK